MADKVEPVAPYVFGVLSIVFAFFQPFAALIIGIIGLVQSNRLKLQRAKKLNIIGIVLSIIFAALSLLLIQQFSQGGLGSSLFPSF